MSLVTVIFTITGLSPVIRGYDSFIGESVGPWRLVCHITTWRISLGSIRNVEFPAFAHWRCHVVMVVCTEILILSNTLSPHLTRNDTMAQNWVCHCPLEATHSGKTLERIPISVTVSWLSSGLPSHGIHSFQDGSLNYCRHLRARSQYLLNVLNPAVFNPSEAVRHTYFRADKTWQTLYYPDGYLELKFIPPIGTIEISEYRDDTSGAGFECYRNCSRRKLETRNF